MIFNSDMDTTNYTTNNISDEHPFKNSHQKYKGIKAHKLITVIMCESFQLLNVHFTETVQGIWDNKDRVFFNMPKT